MKEEHTNGGRHVDVTQVIRNKLEMDHLEKKNNTREIIFLTHDYFSLVNNYSFGTIKHKD